MNDRVMVSVICLTYNHEKYIEQTIKSIVSQITDFKFELIIHDDNSTDRTTNIVREYEKEYPDIINAIYEEENMYSKGYDALRNLCIPVARGKYIAFCEGDDYWIDDKKIQIQYEIMEKSADVDMCSCSAIELCSDGETHEIRPFDTDCILPIEDVIVGGGGYLATNTLFFRKELLTSYMPFERILSMDYEFQIKEALRGGIYYIDKNMTVYRKFTENSWTRKICEDTEKRKSHIEKEISMLRQFDIDTEGRYHDCIERRIEAYTPFYDQLMNHREEFLNELASCRDGIWIWGMGLRGDAAQKFCKNEKIVIDGVCDKQNTGLGEKTEHGQVVDSTENCLKKSKAILASNNIIYNYLIDEGYPGVLINLQKYMPLS